MTIPLLFVTKLLLTDIFGMPLSEFLVWLAGAVAALWAALKTIREIAVVGFLPAIGNFWEWLLRRRKRLETMYRELTPNGGSSIKDVVDRIEGKVDRMYARNRFDDEMSDSAIFELNERGSLTYANCAFRELVNADEQEIEHRKYISRMHDEDRTRFLAALKEAIDNLMHLDTVVRFRTEPFQTVRVRLFAQADVRPDGNDSDAKSVLLGFFGTASTIDDGQTTDDGGS